MTIGDAVRTRREQLGMTQRDIAQQLDTSETTISNIEKGKTQKIPIETVKKLADALNWNIIDFLATIDFLETEDLQKHGLCQFKNWEDLSSEDQQYIQLFIDACAHRDTDEVKL